MSEDGPASPSPAPPAAAAATAPTAPGLFCRERMHPVYWFGHTLSRIVAAALFRFRATGTERIPATGPCILAMNHQSFLDPPLAGICCRRPIHYLARRSLLSWPLLGPLFPKLNVIPVARDRPDMSALKAAIRVIRAGGCTIVFPEGTRSRDGNLQPARPGLGFVIAKTLAPVVPMRIFGAAEAFPRTSKFPRPHPITIAVGEPLAFTAADVAAAAADDADPRAAYLRLSERVMEQIAAIARPPR